MNAKRRMIFGVITAEADNIEQRQILNGIIEEAQKLNIDIACISNIYNPNVTNTELSCENKIYDLILSQELDALIMISESIINTELQQTIKQYLMKRNDIPIIIIGTLLPDFNFQNFQFINTSDENDIMDITNHLIEIHKFNNIDILTGYDFLTASHLRINGYRKALQSHGIAFDEKKVYFGNFWFDSGQNLAKRYINGEILLPQAIICTNDYMAYGLLDEFIGSDISVPDDVTVIGYEYVRQRFYHSPILTTYQRNRKTMGMESVKMLYCKKSGIDVTFYPPKGEIVTGESCSCGIKNKQFVHELQSARTKQQYDQLNLYSQMEHRLTECQSLNDFIKVSGNFHYLIRNVNDVYLCLSENWYNATFDKKSDIMNFQSIVSPFKSAIKCNKYQLSAVFNLNDKASVCYFNPLFFADRIFGYLVLRYDSPDTYDFIFRNWIKSISNALEMLRMKNDIQYLSQCQNLSETMDSMTGLYNENGLKKAYSSMLKNAEDTDILCVLLKVCISDDDYFDIDKKTKISALLDVTKALKTFCGEKNICSRINDNTFVCFVKNQGISADLINDKLNAILIRHNTYMESYGMDSFVSCTIKCEKNMDYSDGLALCKKMIENKMSIISERKILNHYSDMLKIRNLIYSNPMENLSADGICQIYPFSSGYLRSIYKKCFNISFHQECINSKIYMAKYLLITSNMNTTAISEQCGYDDSKYFFRQFMSCSGFTPNQYRNIFSSNTPIIST